MYINTLYTYDSTLFFGVPRPAIESALRVSGGPDRPFSTRRPSLHLADVGTWLMPQCNGV